MSNIENILVNKFFDKQVEITQWKCKMEIQTKIQTTYKNILFFIILSFGIQTDEMQEIINKKIRLIFQQIKQLKNYCK